MRLFCVSAAVALAVAGGGVPAQRSGPPPKPSTPPSQPDVIRRSFDVVTMDVIVRDQKSGQFLPNLKKGDFQIYEDGVRQDVVTLLMVHGGRVYNPAPMPSKAAAEGVILPVAMPTADAAGRIFLILVDDLHLDFSNTGRIRELFRQVSSQLIHDGDMFGVVSTGPSSISIDLTYDRKRLEGALAKISGAGLRPAEILSALMGANGLPEVNYRAHVAFSTAYDVMKNFERVHNRRKAVIYISNGYDLNPFTETRAQNDAARSGQSGDAGGGVAPDANPFSTTGNRFSEADLAAQLLELTREANRANATFYAIDPRGLVAGPDPADPVNTVEWQRHVTTTQNSLRVLADQTGGLALVDRNDLAKGLSRIDAETSDYYVLGYYSSNPDPSRKLRRVRVDVKRVGTTVRSRPSYSLKPK